MDESKLSIVNEIKSHIEDELKQIVSLESELTAQKETNELLVSRIKALEAQQ